MHRIRWARLAVAATSLLLAAGFVGASASAHPSGTRAAEGQSAGSVKVGIIYSRTGLLSAYGGEYIQGLKLGLDYATKGTGKVNGKKIEITAVDDGTDPAKAVTAAKDLIGRGYKIIGGSISSGVALQIAPLAEQNRVLNISGPTATGLAERATWNSYVPGINFLSHYVYNAPKNPVNDWLVKKMKRRNQLPDIFTPDGFVAGQMIVRAVRKGGGEDVDKMISALEGWKFVGPKGPQRIRPEDHAMLQPMFQVRLRTVKGKQVPVPVKTFSPGNVQPPVRPFPS